MSWHGLYSHHVASFEGDIGGVAVVAFAGVFELYFNDVIPVGCSGYVVEPVEAVQFAARASFFFFFHRRSSSLLGEADGAGLAYHGDFHLSGIGHFVLYAAGDFA